MLRWHVVFASVLSAVVVLAVAPGASSAPAPGISISGAEQALQLTIFQYIDVTGTGVCGAAGQVTLSVTVNDLETGATASTISTTECVSPAEHINWVVTATSFSSVDRFRPGDRVNITVSATGAITGTDEKQTTLKQFH
jgi:hypothetical protein